MVMNMLDRDFGALEADVKNLSDRIDKMEQKVDDIHVIITKAKGGWLLLIIIGGALAWFVQSLFPLLKKAVS